MEIQTVIVEHVEAGSAAERAGLRRGDRLTACAGRPLTSPASLHALAENAFGVERLTLCGEREGQAWEWALPPGEIGAELRPELPDAVLEGYERGRAAFRAKRFGEAARIWADAGPRVTGDAARAWIYLRAGSAAGEDHDWGLGHSLCAAALGLLDGCGDTAAQSVARAALGRCCVGRVDLEMAGRWHEQARRADEAAGRPLWAARDINELGRVAWKRGDLADARRRFADALSAFESLTPGSLDVAAGLNNLGLVAHSLGESETAMEQHSRALAIRERLAPYSPDVAKSLNNLGLVLWKRGDLAGAQDYFGRAYDLWERLRPDSLDVAISLHNLGLVSYHRGHMEASLDYYARCLTTRRRLEPDSQETAATLNNIGLIYWERRDLPSAESHLVRALEIWQRINPRSLTVASALTNLGDVARKRGDLAAAQGSYEKAHEIWARLAPDTLESANTLESSGRVALDQGRPAAAADRLRQAVGIIERQRAQIADSGTRALLMAEHHRKYAGLVQSLLAVGDIGAAFHTLERVRSRSFAELLAARALDTVTDAPPELLAEQQEVDHQRGQTYDALTQLSGMDQAQETQQIAALHRTLRELERRQQEVTAKIRAISPRYAALQYPQPLTLEEAQAALEPGTLLLSYLVDDEQTFLFAVTDSDVEAHSLSVGRTALQEQVRAFRQSTDRRRLAHAPAREATQGRALYTLLVGPVRKSVGRAERLLLCPDGPLHTLPFSALVTNSRDRPIHLGAEKPLHSILSMTTYANAQAARPGPNVQTRQPRLLAFGDPLYEGAGRQSKSVPGGDEISALETRGLSVTPLLHSRTEVECLARLYGDAATVRLGAEATKAAVLSEGGGADLLHFACHGWFDPILPLSSGLVLSQGDAPGDSGLLQAWEVFQYLRLSADLVVLSACQSGLGQELRGEGLVGLARAFQYAGARSLVVTLWDVADESTAAFMLAFYAGLKSGLGKDEALRQAVLALQSDPRWDAPFHWAAFVLIGDRN